MKKLFSSVRLALLAMSLVVLPLHAETTDVAGIPGVEGPAFNFLDGKLIVSLKLLLVEIQAGGSMVIPKTKDSRFELVPNIIDGGTLLQVTLDPADIKGVTVANDPNTLPDGRPIPGGIPGGVLPSLRIDTQWLNTSYYFAKTLFGIYFPVKVNTQGIGGTVQFNINGKIGGNFSVVNSDSQGRNAALLLFLRKNAMESFKEKLEESARNPGIMYELD